MPREKVKFALRMSPETQQLVKEMCPRDNCQTQNEFIEKAIRFYAGYVSGQEATAYLPPALTSVLRSTIQATEERIARLLFKLAVEQDMVQIEQDWPTGTVWGTRRTPGTHKDETPCAEACRVMNSYRVSATYGYSGYTSMVSPLIFGNDVNPARRLENLSQITDGNAGETVQWPDRANPCGRGNLDCYGEDSSYRLEVWMQYPESVSYTGDSVMGWPVEQKGPSVRTEGPEQFHRLHHHLERRITDLKMIIF